MGPYYVRRRQNGRTKERYWLRLNSLPWQEATLGQFAEAERTAGFYPTSGFGPLATSGFSGGGISGRITTGEITEEVYGWDPEFVRDARA